MARRISYSARYPLHTTKEVYAVFADRAYWEARMEEMRKYSPNNMVSFAVTDAGIELELNHILPRDQLPEIAQTVMRKDMVITRKESYSALDPGSEDHATATYSASIPAGPGSLTGTMRLFPTDTGCTFRTTSVAKVFIPVMGPRFEQLMLVNLVDLFRAEAEFTAGWLDKHYPS
jgi:hypothetical protein